MRRPEECGGVRRCAEECGDADGVPDQTEQVLPSHASCGCVIHGVGIRAGPTTVVIDIRRGIRQGCPVRMLLFCPSLDPLLRMLKATRLVGRVSPGRVSQRRRHHCNGGRCRNSSRRARRRNLRC